MLLYIHKHIKDHGPFICVADSSIIIHNLYTKNIQLNFGVGGVLWLYYVYAEWTCYQLQTKYFISQLLLKFNLNIFYCLNNDKRIRHKFFNLVLSSPYTYNIQYDKHYYYIISLKCSHEDMKQKMQQYSRMQQWNTIKGNQSNRPEYKKKKENGT